MSTTSEQLLCLLEENASLLKKAQVNMKKCPKQRLTKGYIGGRLKCIEEYWQSFKTAHQELVKCTPKQQRMDIQYFANEDYYVVEEVYLCLVADLNDNLNATNTNQMNTSDISNVHIPHVKLPIIQLPTFAGNYEQWPTFYDLFSSLVDLNTTLSNVQKLHYLKLSLTGEAEALLKHIKVTENNYEQALNILKQRYGNKRAIVNSLFKRLFSQRKAQTQTANQIKALLDTTTECLNCLQNLQVLNESSNAMIVYLTVQRLDLETHKAWEDHICNHDSEVLPTWAELKNFLESKFRALEMTTPTTSYTKENKAIKEKSYHVSTSSQVKHCIICEEEHTLCHCKQFTKLPLEERTKFVRNKNLCYNCLIPGHSAVKCRLQVSCRLCKRRHHTLLHQPKNDKPSDSLQAHFTDVEENTEPIVNDQPAEVLISSHLATKRTTALLATALLPVKDERGHFTILRALIDQGSQANFISERATQLLHLRGTPVKGTVTGVGSTHTSVNQEVKLELLSRYDNQFKLQIKAYVMSTRLTTHLPTKSITYAPTHWPHLEGLSLADPKFYQSGRVDMLLGVEVYAQILKNEVIKGPPGSPCAQKTSLGWILFGNVQADSSESIIVMHHQCNIDHLLETLWELETEDKKRLTQEEEKCETIYKETHRRNKDGRYIVKLPFKTENPDILNGNSRQIAMQRLLQLEKRFERNNKLKTEYRKVIEEYIDLNHLEEVPVNEIDNPSVYLPHHAVIKESSETTKVRVVFDASALDTNNVSLNKDMLVGPTLQDDIRSLVMRWRLRRVAYVADIEKMFRQILVSKEVANYQRILWRREENGPIKDYRLLRVTFGTAAAPYLAVKTLRQVAEDEGSEYPLAAETIKEDFFMDDLLSGNDSVLETIDTATQVASILKRGGFSLQKWSSNSTEFMKHFTQNEKSSLERIDIPVNSMVRALGLSWNIGYDTIQYNLNLPAIPKVITKRSILSETQMFFDPLGWLTPVLVPAKQLIQKLWLQRLGWDDPVDFETSEEWLRIRRSLEHVKTIQLERWLQTTRDNMYDVSIHGFSDASTKAYGAVACLRVRTENGEYKTGIIAAKSRVAPVKPVSLPRLELCGAVLLSQLLKQISRATRIPASQIYAWTDSTIVLSWLRGDPARWQTFVRNRVVTILDNSGNQWYHVQSSENPADVASRGMLLPELETCNLWWNGPAWLKNEFIEISEQSNISTDLEMKKEFLTNLKVKEDSEDKRVLIQFEDYNSIQELLKTIVYCKRFLNYNRYRDMKTGNNTTYHTTEELDKALEICIRIAQEEDFRIEITELKENKPINNKSKVKNLNPYLDSKNILRVGGRLRQAHMEENTKHPIILGHQNGLVTLLIADAHKKTLHGGIQLMMNYLRTRFWIIRVKSLVTTYLHRCTICARQRARYRTQMMGDLPEARVTPARPFLHSGVDYAGPVQVLMSRGRGTKCHKGYICIFICMATKAIHLELVGDLSTNTFLNAFRRFVSRRGKCSHIYSDRGTNFVGSNKELIDLWRAANLDIPGDLTGLLAEEGTQWHFNPPYSPNFGGLWEAGVKSVKYHLKRILNCNLTFEEMSTILCQIEACLNSRPLCPIDQSDTETLNVLTPGHFLIGEAPITIPEPDLTHLNVNRLTRWQYTQQLVQHFWKRWQAEYLSRMQQRPKWLQLKQEFEVGDVVLVREENLPPSKWALGRIVAKHPGKDTVCRVYSLRCLGKIIKRSISKLCELPVNDKE